MLHIYIYIYIYVYSHTLIYTHMFIFNTIVYIYSTYMYIYISTLNRAVPYGGLRAFAAGKGYGLILQGGVQTPPLYSCDPYLRP